MLLFSEDTDLVGYEPALDNIISRKDPKGNVLVPSAWAFAHQRTSEELVRLLEVSTAGNRRPGQSFDIARVSEATREKLRPTAVHFSLFFIYDRASSTGPADSANARRSRHYWDRAQQLYQMATASGIEYARDANTLGTERTVPTSIEILLG